MSFHIEIQAQCDNEDCEEIVDLGLTYEMEMGDVWEACADEMEAGSSDFVLQTNGQWFCQDCDNSLREGEE